MNAAPALVDTTEVRSTSGTLEAYLTRLDQVDLLKVNGKVEQVIGLVIESVGPNCALGDVCMIKSREGHDLCLSEVVGFRSNRVLSMILGDASRVGPGSEIVATGRSLSINVGRELLGRVIDGLGRPLDGKGPIVTEEVRSIYASPPNPLTRRRITETVATGIRSIDALLTIGKGQRVGIFAGSGVGKSTLMGMIALDTDLGPEGLRRSVVIVATSDQASLIRLKAAFMATTIAEYFRDAGMDVMLMMDSVTRLAMAQREVGLAIGEPPTTKGYTPSVFAMLPKLLERAGNSRTGSITGLFTVLVEGDDMTEPVADAVRSILDGHIVLSRRLASSGQYPAVDALESVSRVMPAVASPAHRAAVHRFLDMMATYRESEDLINIGAYVKGSNPRIDRAVRNWEAIRDFLRQDSTEKADFKGSIGRLLDLIARAGIV